MDASEPPSWTLRAAPKKRRGFHESPLSLAHHADVDGVVLEDGAGVLGWKVTAPHEGHLGKGLLQAPAVGNSLVELRAGHHRHPDRGELSRPT